jgi:hypothetical protein
MPYTKYQMEKKKQILDNIESSVNYIEIILKNISSEDIFYEKMSRLSNENYKYFQKEYKQYISENMYYQNLNNEDVSVFKSECKQVDEYPKYMIAYNTRTKLSLMNFASSIKINSISYVRKLIFRITNRIYINFEVKKYNDNLSYLIYINYNHDTSVDIEVINKELYNILKLILPEVL